MSPVPDNDPDKDGNTQLETPNVIMAVGSDSDEDTEYPADMGYQLLPQEPGGHGDDNEDSDMETNQQPPSSPLDHAVISTLNHTDLVPPADNSIYDACGDDSELEERANLWNEFSHPKEPEMNPDHAQQILQAMSNFTLPASHHPHWARQISEDEWKDQLLSRIHPKTPNNSSQESDSNEANR